MNLFYPCLLGLDGNLIIKLGWKPCHRTQFTETNWTSTFTPFPCCDPFICTPFPVVNNPFLCVPCIALFPRSEAKGKYVLFRSQQRRLRLVLLQQRGNSSVICRALSRQLHIWIDQQRGNMLVFSLCSRWFCGFRLKSKNGTVRRAGPLGGFYTIGLG